MDLKKTTKCFIILGMHRSATSLCAKGLYENDVFIGGHLLGADPTNPYGHFEDIEMSALNRKILMAAGGSWDNPPSEEAILSLQKKFAPEIAKAVSERKKSLWGWKDPRTTLTVKLFLPYIENPHFFCCFRDPADVARSLEKRNRFPIEKGFTIARIYNRRLRAFLCDVTEREGWSNITF